MNFTPFKANSVPSGIIRPSSSRKNLVIRALVAACLAAVALSGAPSESAARPETDTPSLTVSPTTLYFHTTITHTSYPRIVTLTNTGNAAAVFTFIGLEGAGRGEFALIKNTCGTSLDAGSSCTLELVFEPDNNIATGVEIYIQDDAADSPQIVQMYGQGH